MNFSDSCPGCDEHAPMAAHGVVAPFVGELIGASIGRIDGLSPMQ